MRVAIDHANAVVWIRVAANIQLDTFTHAMHSLAARDDLPGRARLLIDGRAALDQFPGEVIWDAYRARPGLARRLGGLIAVVAPRSAMALGNAQLLEIWAATDGETAHTFHSMEDALVWLGVESEPPPHAWAGISVPAGQLA